MEFEHVFAVVTGLAFTFFLLALISSGLVEALASLFLWRGTYLRKSIETMIGASGDAGQAGQGFAWQGPADWLRAHATRGPAAPPPGRDPALVAIDDRLARHPLSGGTLARLPAYVAPDDFASALMSALPAPGLPIAERVAMLPDGTLKTVLASILQATGDDPARLRAGIARWYESAMVETRMIYKRFVQAMTFAVATLITLAADIDAVALARALWGGALPLGWPGAPDLGHLPGFALTILAAWLGAPFWFELLQNVASLRSATAPANPAVSAGSEA